MSHMKQITKNMLVKEGFLHVKYKDGRDRFVCLCEGQRIELTYDEACDVLRKEEPQKYGAAA